NISDHLSPTRYQCLALCERSLATFCVPSAGLCSASRESRRTVHCNPSAWLSSIDAAAIKLRRSGEGWAELTNRVPIGPRQPRAGCALEGVEMPLEAGQVGE